MNIHKIPLTEYYDLPPPESQPTGELVKLENPGITEGNMLKVRKMLLEFSKKRDYSVGGDIRRYIQVQYIDIWGEEHVEFYLFNDFGEREKLDEEEGRKVFEEYRNKYMEMLFIRLPELNAELLYEKWLAILQKYGE